MAAVYKSGHKGKITGPDWIADVKSFEIGKKALVFDSTVFGTGAGVGKTYTLGLDESDFTAEVLIPNITAATYVAEGTIVAAVLYLSTGASDFDKLTGNIYIDQILFRVAIDDLVRATIRGMFNNTNLNALDVGIAGHTTEGFVWDAAS